VALVAGGSVYSWGDNSFGELGNGGTAASATPALVVLPYGGHAVAAAGGAFTLDTGVVIPRIASTTTVLPAATVTYGQATILQANVAPTDGGGTLAFFADGSSTPISGCESATWFASFVTPGQWAATCAPVLAVGTHSITAKFSGDRFYLPSDGTLADAATVNQAPTTTTVTASPNPGTLGQPETLTATVGGTDGGGTVSFASDGSTITGCDMVPLAMTSGAWTATCVTSDLARGPHSISATYTGDTSYAGSSGTMGGQLVIQVPTTLTAVNVHILSSLGGLKIRFQATLTETISGAPIAGQQVTFTSSLLGLNTKCVGTTDANGVATCQATVNALLGGGYDATFAGTALYQPSTSHAQVLL
jgi:hypothetical protein